VISQLDLAAAGADAGEVGELRAAVEADPKNLDARFDLAMALYGNGDREGAVDELLESIRINRAHNEEAARKQLIKLFEAFGHTDPLTIDARKRLSSILFS
jgi:putative thioredoxin